MKHYATFDKFNIGFDITLKKFFITSKEDGLATAGGFLTARDAILFELERIIK